MRSAIGYAFCLCLILAAGCTRYKASYKKANSKAGPVKPGDDNQNPDGQGGVKNPTSKPTEIQLANTKFAGQEGKLQAVVKFGGAQVKPAMTADGQVVRLSVDGLPSKEKDVLTVELYEGDALRFVARRGGTTLTAEGENKVQIEDCLVLVAPWDGLGSEGGCNWTIEEAAN